MFSKLTEEGKMNNKLEVTTSGQVFNRIFGRSPTTFMTIPEVDKFVQRKNGKELKFEYVHRDICSSRGSVFDIKKVGDADEQFDKALARR